MRALLTVSFLIVCTGCSPEAPATIPVTGLVTINGQPLAAANVIFVPQGETKGNGGMGQTNETGRFTVHMHDNQQTQGPPGLFPGQYKVLVSKMVNPDGTPFVASEDIAPIDSDAKELLPEIYSHYEQTTLFAEIQPPSNELKFDLQTSLPRR